MSDQFVAGPLTLQWTVGWHADAASVPERFVPATVPGAVQLDWARAEGWPPYWVNDEYKQYAWMEDVWWTYRAELPNPELSEEACVWLEIEGVDYSWSLWLDDQLLHRQEGMCRGLRLMLPRPAFSGRSVIRIVVAPAPKSQPTPANRDQANHSCKPAVSYGWDFHPRLIPLGIWRPVKLEVRPAAHLVRVETSYELAPQRDEVVFQLQIEKTSSAPGLPVHWQIHDRHGNPVGEHRGRIGEDAPCMTVANPELWWPNGYGDPVLYTSTCTLLDSGGQALDVCRRKVGVRSLRLVNHPGTWDEPSRFPKGPSTPPITLEINGQPIFGKGTNLVSPEIFPGTVTRERWRTLLDHAKSAHFNLLRLWGGAPVPGDEFFDLCDEKGLLAWVEFPLACNNYPDSAGYLEVLDAESRAIITRLRPHASVAFWCGGNELFNGWSGMTPQSHAIRLLDRNCFDLDRSRPFLPTSPVFGMGHGHYAFYDSDADEEAWQVFQRSSCTGYTEFGIPGPSPEKVLRSFMPDEELFPPKPGTAWETHHGFNAWLPESHLALTIQERYFGPPDNLTMLLTRGQWMQAEGLRGLFEEARRQKPLSSMALSWCFNEPWPAAANCSLIAWPAEPKPALATVGKACRPTLASAKIPKFQWTAGELLSAELWLLNDALTAIPPGRIDVSIRADHEEQPLLSWNHQGTSPMTNLRGPCVQWLLPVWETDCFELILTCVENAGWSSSYKLACRPQPVPKKSDRIISILNF